MRVEVADTITIHFPSTFTRRYRQVITRYLAEGWGRLSPDERKLGFEAFNILHTARVQYPTGSFTFHQVYERYVERVWADRYISRLLALSLPAKQHPALRRRIAALIVASLQKAGLVRPAAPHSQVLLAYILHWWESFAAGYAFEVEVFHDLRESGIEFEAHDLRDRVARRSSYDLKVLGLPGDVKTSLYFLRRPERPSVSQFYITRLETKQRTRTLVVFLKPEAWAVINGETLVTHLERLSEVLPQTAQVQVGSFELIVADYEVWKDKVCRKQSEEQEVSDA